MHAFLEFLEIEVDLENSKMAYLTKVSVLP